MATLGDYFIEGGSGGLTIKQDPSTKPTTEYTEAQAVIDGYVTVGSGGTYTDIRTAFDASQYKLFLKVGTHQLEHEVIQSADESAPISTYSFTKSSSSTEATFTSNDGGTYPLDRFGWQVGDELWIGSGFIGGSNFYVRGTIKTGSISTTTIVLENVTGYYGEDESATVWNITNNTNLTISTPAYEMPFGTGTDYTLDFLGEDEDTTILDLNGNFFVGTGLRDYFIANGGTWNVDGSTDASISANFTYHDSGFNGFSDTGATNIGTRGLQVGDVMAFDNDYYGVPITSLNGDDFEIACYFNVDRTNVGRNVAIRESFDDYAWKLRNLTFKQTNVTAVMIDIFNGAAIISNCGSGDVWPISTDPNVLSMDVQDITFRDIETGGSNYFFCDGFSGKRRYRRCKFWDEIEWYGYNGSMYVDCELDNNKFTVSLITPHGNLNPYGNEGSVFIRTTFKDRHDGLNNRSGYQGGKAYRCTFERCYGDGSGNEYMFNIMENCNIDPNIGVDTGADEFGKALLFTDAEIEAE